MKHLIFFATTLFASAALAEMPTTSLTIYSTAVPGMLGGAVPGDIVPGQVPGYAIVRNERMVEIPEEKSTVQFSDVAAYIDPTTVIFSSLTDPEHTRVISQNYLFDLANSAALLTRYVGRTIEVEQTNGGRTERSSGKLLGTDGGIILQDNDGRVKTLSQYSAIRFPALPEGLMAKPTLVWDVTTGDPGEHTIRVSYQTRGLGWWADYNALFTEGKDANQGVLDISSWVSIMNKSGASYTDSALKLLAGDVHRMTHEQNPAPMMMAKQMAPAFEEKTFAEYHLYALKGKVNLPDNSTKQMELFPTVTQVPVAVLYAFDGEKSNTVSTRITFQNNSNYGLGIPLPAGRIRINKRDPQDGSLEFIGEDAIPHTPKNEEVNITLGQSFDITGKRVVKNRRRHNEQRWAEEEVEITLKNRKDMPVMLMVIEHLDQSDNWTIANPSDEYEKYDAKTLRFPLKLEKNSERKVSYTVHYSW